MMLLKPEGGMLVVCWGAFGGKADPFIADGLLALGGGVALGGP
jgi:hypothetical protein